MRAVRVAVVGAGLIGRRHIEEVQANSSIELAAVVDPAAAGAELAQQANVPAYASLAGLFAVERPDGVIIATPNRLHVEHGLQCVQAGVPALVEKPIGDTVEDARRLVEAAEAAQVPLVTGHHRQHSPIMRSRVRSSNAVCLAQSWPSRAPHSSTNQTTISMSAAAGAASPVAGRS